MNLRSLECAIALADKGHFGRAASYLNTTQPAFSQRIATLEEEVGHQLFDRSKSPIALTEAGDALVRRARQVIAHADAAKEDARQAALGLSGTLCIGFTHIALYQNFPEVLSHFRDAFPSIHTELLEKLSIDLEHLLIKDELDIGVVHPPLAHQELDVHYLDESPLLLAIPSHWPLAQQSSIGLSECKTLPFILPPRHIGSTFYDGIIAACNNAGFTPEIAQEAAPMSTVIGLVSSGVGAGFVTANFSVIQRPGVTFLKITNRLPTLTTLLAWKKGSTNPMIQHFINTLSPREQAKIVKM